MDPDYAYSMQLPVDQNVFASQWKAMFSNDGKFAMVLHD